MVAGGTFPMELFDQERGFARLLDGLKSMGRVTVFDRRGIVLSDPISDWDRPIIDQWAEYPERVQSLVLFHPMMTTDDEWETWSADRFGQVRDNLAGGKHDFLELLVPSSAADASFRDWYTRAGRIGASPATAARVWESVFRSHPRDQRLSEVGDFVVGERRLPPPDRVLAAAVFTDLVASTERAASLGDGRWKAVLDRHELADDGLGVRIGLHVGDVHRRGAVPQSVVVALAGQRSEFEPHGVQSLKGVPGEWALFKLADS